MRMEQASAQVVARPAGGMISSQGWSRLTHCDAPGTPELKVNECCVVKGDEGEDVVYRGYVDESTMTIPGFDYCHPT